jgi:hypothetical protein
MSPSDPPSRINEPSVSRYALLTHCCPASPPPRLRWIDGKATLTTLPSSNAMLDPRMVATSVSRLTDAAERRFARAVGGVESLTHDQP